eukprot:scaffold22842_cov73-Skeletonema_dohrnii-CCMP3373.AAC.2
MEQSPSLKDVVRLTWVDRNFSDCSQLVKPIVALSSSRGGDAFYVTISDTIRGLFADDKD